MLSRVENKLHEVVTEEYFLERLMVIGGQGTALYHRLKRMLDVVLGVSLLVLLVPVLILIAVWIKLDSPGRIFYVQERVGSRRRARRGVVVWELCNFPFYKFRSMSCDADPSIHREYIREFCRGQSAANGTSGASFKLQNDPRVTRVGRILRKTSLDELPQLLNVLKGEMSLVGPRPVPPYEVAHYQKAHYGRFAALPGITGLWQIRGRGRVPFEEMIRMDIEYAQRPSLRLDMKLLLLTIPAVVWRRGAE